MSTAERRMTVPAFTALKAAGRKISMLTAYDYTLASLVDEFAAVRAATIAEFDAFFPDEWVRSATASGKTMSVRALAWVIAGHELHHLAILRERYA